MSDLLEIYKCDVCGNIVEVVHDGDGELVCCGETMKRFQGKSADEGKEKHVPMIESVGSGLKVSVGSTPHPMEENHHIEWIEVIEGEKITRHHLRPGDTPETIFACQSQNVVAREYCNVHGLWRS